MLRNIFPKIFFVFFLCCFLLLTTATKTYAQTNSYVGLNCTKSGDNKYKCIESKNCAPGYIYGQNCTNTSSEKTAEEIIQYEKNNSSAVINIDNGEANGCNPLNNFSVTGCLTTIVTAIFTGILKFLNWLLSFVLWLASFIFDLVVYFTIVKFKSNFGDLKFAGIGTVLFGNSGAGLIYFLWGMIRDFLNILIFLSVIFSAVRSMFEGFENTRKRFITLLVFSIVANFSLLFVKIAIDVSNILSLQAYTLAIKPKGVSTLDEFRTSSVDKGPESYGEYIRRAVDLDKLLNSNTGISSAQIQIDGAKNIFMFQLGRMVVYIGVIYVLLFMAGLLLTRAVILLFAMIISPLIAADIFFQMLDPENKYQAIGRGVRNITSKIKGDFYDALIKGPLLIFFIFLIGVFAESVLSQGVIDTVTGSLGKGSDVKLIADNPFTKNIFVFFKFALFIYLCRSLFNILDNIKLGSVPGTRLRGYGASFANQILGRGVAGLSRAGGAIGRNTLGRAASNPSGVIGNTVATLNNRAEDWKKSELFLKRTAGNILGGATKAIRSGTYDARNAIKPETRLGKGIANAAGGLITTLGGPKAGKIDLGVARKEGFEAALKKRGEESKEKIDKAIKNAGGEKGKDLMATREMKSDAMKEAKKETKIGDSAVTLEMLDKVLENREISDKVTRGEKLSEIEKKSVGIQDLSEENIKVLSSAVKRDPDILNKIDTARDKANETADKKVVEKITEEKKKMEKQIREEVEKSVDTKDRKASFADKIKRTGSSLPELLGDALTGNRTDIQEGVADKFKKEEAKTKAEKSKEEIKKQIKKYSVAGEAQRDLEDDLSEVETALKLRVALTPDQISDLTKLKTEIEKSISTLSVPEGKVEEKQRKEVIERFNENLRSKILEDKKTASEILSNVYSKKESPELIRKLNFAKNELQDELSAIENSRPDPTGKSSAEIFAANKIHAKQVREAKKKFEIVDNMLKGGYSNARKISESLDKLKDKIEANFNEPKPDAPKPTT